MAVDLFIFARQVPFFIVLAPLTTDFPLIDSW